MSLDIEGVLWAHQIEHDRRCYPAYACSCGWDGAQGDDGSANDGRNDNANAARAHVAAVLREQIESALAEAWDDGHDCCTYPICRANPYRAAHLSDTERAGGAE